MQDQKLMDYFKFDESDLQANRMGQFTEKQKKRLAKEVKWDQAGSMFGGGCLILVSLCVFVVVAAIVSTAWKTDLVFSIFMGIGMGIIFPLSFFIWGLRVLRSAFSKSSNIQFQLARTEGPLYVFQQEHHTSDTHGNRMGYSVYKGQVGSLAFELDSSLREIMKQGDIYAVYSSKGTESEVMSIELISSAEDGASPVLSKDKSARIDMAMDILKAKGNLNPKILEQLEKAKEELQRQAKKNEP